MKLGLAGRHLAALVLPLLSALGGAALLDGRPSGFLLGGGAWLAVRLGPMRALWLTEHRTGMAASREEDWSQALAAFAASEAAWRRRPWLDRWRSLVLGATGPWGYARLAQYNQVVCLWRLGRVEEARSALARLLREAPTMREARALEQALGRAPRPAGWDELLDLR